MTFSGRRRGVALVGLSPLEGACRTARATQIASNRCRNDGFPLVFHRFHGVHGAIEPSSSFCDAVAPKRMWRAVLRRCDHYAALEVSKVATQRELREAYLRLAKQHHPDKESCLLSCF